MNSKTANNSLERDWKLAKLPFKEIGNKRGSKLHSVENRICPASVFYQNRGRRATHLPRPVSDLQTNCRGRPSRSKKRQGRTTRLSLATCVSTRAFLVSQPSFHRSCLYTLPSTPSSCPSFWCHHDRVYRRTGLQTKIVTRFVFRLSLDFFSQK